MLAEALGRLSVESLEKLVEIIGGEPGETATDMLKQIIDFVVSLTDKIEKIDAAAIQHDVEGVATAIERVVEGIRQMIDFVESDPTLAAIFGEGGVLGTPGEAFNQRFEEIPTLYQRMEGGGSLGNLNQSLQDIGVNITLTVDENGQLQVRNIAKQEANTAVGALVEGVTDSRRPFD
jgi:hypothetical protein